MKRTFKRLYQLVFILLVPVALTLHACAPQRCPQLEDSSKKKHGLFKHKERKLSNWPKNMRRYE